MSSYQGQNPVDKGRRSILTMNMKPFGRAVRRVRSYLPEANFLTIHYLYFIITCLISAIIFWSAATPFRSVRFIDAVFLCVSAMTLAGLNTINLSTLNTFQQIILLILIIIGSAIFVSAFVVQVRRKAFDSRFRTEIEREQRSRSRSPWFPRNRRLSRRSQHELKEGKLPKRIEPKARLDSQTEKEGEDITTNGESIQLEKENNETPEALHSDFDRFSDATIRSPISLFASPDGVQQDHITFSEATRFRDSTYPSSGLVQRVFSMSGVGARSNSHARRLTVQTATRPSHDRPRTFSDESGDEVVSSGFIARNSNFHHLTEADRLRLGGTEYKAVTMLAWIVPTYFVAWQLLSGIALGAYVNNYYASIARENGLNPWYKTRRQS
jgi:hypothetical protein